MFYTTDDNNHGLPHDPFKAIVAPRPIGWIGSQDKNGVKNLAPYSYFNAIADHPKLVMFASSGQKDSVTNCQQNGCFSVNIVGLGHLEQMNKSSADFPADRDEFIECDIPSQTCKMINAPMVQGAVAVLECQVSDIFAPKTIDGTHNHAQMVIGQVVAIHIQDEMIKDGRFDVTSAQTLSRLGYFDYSHIDKVFELRRPKYTD